MRSAEIMATIEDLVALAPRATGTPGGEAAAGEDAQHDLRRLVPQLSGLRQIFPAGQHHHAPAVFRRAHGMHLGGNVVGDALGQPQRYAAAGGNVLS